MNELALQYPPEECPFCNIGAAFPYPSTSPSTSTSPTQTSTENSEHTVTSCPHPQPPLQSQSQSLQSCIPSTASAEPTKTSPSSFVVLSSPTVLAFLDILPMTKGHLLVATRRHCKTAGEMEGSEGAHIGFWLPVLARVVSRVTGVTDYNIVQNNGARAAQVVPHVHFHIIPRPESMPEIKSKSWAMFGRGQRDELDDDEGEKIAAEMREALRQEVEKMEKAKL